MEQPRKRVLLVDEDTTELLPFIVELGLRNIEVIHFTNATKCLISIKNGTTADMAFIDVMLAPGEEFKSEETMGFLATGPVLARKIRDVGSEMPIVFFTHTAQTRILEYITGTINQIGNSALLLKKDFPDPFAFGDAVEKLLSKGLKKSALQKFLSAISESISFNVKAGPLGIDLKKAAKTLTRGSKERRR